MKQYRHVRVADPSEFDRRSFRTVTQGSHRVVVGCPKGHYRGGRCTVGLRPQAILHPVEERNPCATCADIASGKNPPLVIVNPPRRGELFADAVYAIEYRHAHDGKRYRHDFEYPEDVSLVIKGSRAVEILARRDIVRYF